MTTPKATFTYTVEIDLPVNTGHTHEHFAKVLAETIVDGLLSVQDCRIGTINDHHKDTLGYREIVKSRWLL